MHAAPTATGSAAAPLDRLMPRYDIVERHHIAVAAPAAITVQGVRRDIRQLSLRPIKADAERRSRTGVSHAG